MGCARIHRAEILAIQLPRPKLIQLNIVLNLMAHQHGVSPKKDLNLVLYVCKTKATGKHLCCGFPIEYFHCFSQRLCACVSSSPYGCWWNPSFRCGVLQALCRQVVFTWCFHSAGTCYWGEPSINMVYLVKQQVARFPCGFTKFVEGMRESCFPTDNEMESC